MLSFGLVFFTLSLSIGVNLSDGFLARMGFDPNLLMAAAVAFVITGLIVHRHLALVVSVVLLTIGANLPAATAASIGYDPDFMLAGLIAVVLLPLTRRLFG